MTPAEQVNLEMTLCIAIIALFIIWLGYAWWFNNESTRRIQEVNDLYINLSQNQSLCTGFTNRNLNVSLPGGR